ncbi:MAG: MdtA/MuxA family multidrug efflux RND transporter periplasmic adaptor subunit [Magnetococcales bacterium]|nr:MdtA/MuxA family multidrug efflux RND transporter periplasmic adaptor subunit [Magnetococcales bacterium]
MSPADPPLRQRQWCCRKLTLLSLLLLAAGAGWWSLHRGELPSEQTKEKQKNDSRKGGGERRPQPVSVAEVKVTNLPVWLSTIGTVTPVAQVTVRSRVDGELIRLHFKEGGMVQKGQLLAEIDPRPFQAQLRQARGQLTRDLALLDNARLDLARYRELWSKDAIAKQQLDSQQSLVRQYQGTVDIDRGQVETYHLQLQFARMTAPISGRIGLKQVDQGNVIHASDASGLAVITQLQPMMVLFSLPEKHVSSLLARLNGPDPVSMEAWDRDQKRRVATGHLTATDSVVDNTTGSIRLKGEFPNTNNELFPGQFVSIQVLTETLPETLVAPAAAIQQGANGSYVFAVHQDDTVKVVSVSPGPGADGWVALTPTSLKAGDRLVLEGIDKLRDGARVEVMTPGAPPAAAKPSTETRGDHRRQTAAGKKGEGRKHEEPPTTPGTPGSP